MASVGLKPQSSTVLQFGDKVHGAVGLYVDPPRNEALLKLWTRVSGAK